MSGSILNIEMDFRLIVTFNRPLVSFQANKDKVKIVRTNPATVRHAEI